MNTTQGFGHIRRPLPASLVVVAAASLATVPMLPSAAIPSLPTLSIAVKDTVRGPGEDIAFLGSVSVTGKIIYDPVFNGPPVLQLVVDLSQVKGVGMTSGTLYVTTAQSVLDRPLIAFDPIKVSFPYYPTGNLLSARTALASFGVSFKGTAGIGMTSRISAPAF